MIRTRCEGLIDYNRCKHSYRSRIKHKLCRECYRRTNQSPRPIESREVLHGMNRRTRNRRLTVAKQTPKVIANRNNRNKNAPKDGL